MKGTVGTEASVLQNCTKRNNLRNTREHIMCYSLWTNSASRNICGHKKYKIQLSFKKAIKNLATIINKLGMNKKNQLHTQG